MVKKLTKLRIDEVSLVDKGAGEGVQVMLYKRDNTDDTPYLFDDIMKRQKRKSPFNRYPFHPIRTRKANDPHSGQPPNSPTDADKAPLSVKLDELVTEMIAATGGDLHPQRARRWLLHTPHGRELLAQHKRETPMPTVDIMKLHNPDSVIEFIKSSGASEHVISEVIMGHAKLNKRDGESDAQAFARVFPKFQTAYGVAKGYPNLMSVEPVSVEVGDTSVADDSWKASGQLAALVEEQRRLAPWMTATQAWEAIYADPANKALVVRAHKLPTTSSVNTDYLEA
jgi:hypothetical protein